MDEKFQHAWVDPEDECRWFVAYNSNPPSSVMSEDSGGTWGDADSVAVAAEVLRLAEENRSLKEGARLVLAGFESGAFIRDISGDGSPGWMLKLVEPLRGLALLAEHGKE